MSSCDCTVRWNYKTTIKPASLSLIKAYFLLKMVHLLPSSYMYEYTVVQSGMVSTNIGNGWSDDCRGFSQYLIYSQPIRATWPESTLLSIATQVNIYLLTHTHTHSHPLTPTHTPSHPHTHLHPHKVQRVVIFSFVFPCVIKEEVNHRIHGDSSDKGWEERVAEKLNK